MHRSNLTIFSQIAQTIDKDLVAKVVREHQADKHSKGFPVWNQLMCMLFCHLSNAQSLRDITYGMCSTTGNLNHIDVRSLPRRSTLSYANAHRNWEVFRDIYLALHKKLNGKLGGRRIDLPIKSKVYLLDASLVQMSLAVFDWAIYRQVKGAMKLHTVLDYDSAMPTYIYVTDGKQNEIIHTRDMTFPEGCVVVADRGYLDFALLNQWSSKQNIRFVVRGRKKMEYDVMEELSADYEGVVSDQIIQLTGIKGGRKYPERLRRVEVWDEENQKRIILLTNDLTNWTAETISNLYRARWEIELFFKDVKQHMKIKSFVGTSLNAVLIQIWTAMITLLLLKYLKELAKFGWHLSNLVSFLRFNLLVSVHLYKWLDEPIFTRARSPGSSVQLTLFEVK